MPTFNQSILTNAGTELLGKVNGGQDSIIYTRIVFSSMDNSNQKDDQIKALTDISPKELVSNASTYQNNGSDETNVRGYVNNSGMSNGLYVKTYGIYAKNKDGKEILFAVECADHPDYLIPNSDGKHPSGLLYTFKISISATDNVTFTSSSDIFATQSDLKRVEKEIDTSSSQTLETALNSVAKNYASKSTSLSMLSDITNPNDNFQNYTSLGIHTVALGIGNSCGGMPPYDNAPFGFLVVLDGRQTRKQLYFGYTESVINFDEAEKKWGNWYKMGALSDKPWTRLDINLSNHSNYINYCIRNGIMYFNANVNCSQNDVGTNKQTNVQIPELYNSDSFTKYPIFGEDGISIGYADFTNGYLTTYFPKAGVYSFNSIVIPLNK
ncbi:hypothetical protein IV37_GL000199 [Fructilactobacillus fructivorans]|uniref:hypothetical protein n=1 Tax=Fructilactobacillus fructivorans TaxID=1614 RepID=UPI000704A81E|nr:hypothetical protein [Fructilactobacillus fructivorans]KRN13477.1 hypothetical protein IV37_GL000199 [Fructilactobacillus fructivorans]